MMTTFTTVIKLPLIKLPLIKLVDPDNILKLLCYLFHVP